MTMSSIKGVITAMATPFAEDGSLDVAAARKLARHLVEHGSHGVVVAGTTGEGPTLNDDEKLELLGATLEEIGDEATVICGTGSNDTRHTCELTSAASNAGAHAVLVVAPYYNRPTPAGIKAHFAEASGAAGETPVVLYNIPSRCAINMPPELMAELAAENANIVAVKQANNDEMGLIDGLDVFAGNDDIYRQCLEMGGTGGILVASHLVGNEMRAIYDAIEAGEIEKSKKIENDLKHTYKALAVTPPATAVKAGLKMMGVLEHDTMRLPMVSASDEERGVIRAELERRGVLSAS
ncbi:4-hydroxy-tetrahydrodipicolinate synthase [soil metagenome]